MNGISNDMKDHDLLVRLDEKVDVINKALTTLLESLDQRGRDIDALKTANLLHQQETKDENAAIEALKTRIASIEGKNTITDKNIEILTNSSIMLWAQRHPKPAMALAFAFLIMLNFHDIITPYLMALIGYKFPTP